MPLLLSVATVILVVLLVCAGGIELVGRDVLVVAPVWTCETTCYDFQLSHLSNQSVLEARYSDWCHVLEADGTVVLVIEVAAARLPARTVGTDFGSA